MALAIIVDPDPNEKPSCIVKLTNTTVDKASIYGTDIYRMLDASYSVINELDGSMSFTEVENSTDVPHPTIELLSSKITVNTIDVSGMHDLQTVPLINSEGHSMSYFRSILHDLVSIPFASPEWTPYDAEQPFYGNLMSYNIGEVEEAQPPSSSSGPQ